MKALGDHAVATATLTPAPGESSPSLARQAYMQAVAEQLCAQAEIFGLVLTIERRSLQPLAMGHHEAVVSVYPLRERAQ